MFCPAIRTASRLVKRELFAGGARKRSERCNSARVQEKQEAAVPAETLIKASADVGPRRVAIIDRSPRRLKSFFASYITARSGKLRGGAMNAIER